MVDLLIKEIQKLTKPTRKLLECASSMGSNFSVDLLSKLAELTSERTLRLLGEAKQHGFVQPKYVSNGVSVDVSGSGASILSNLGALPGLSGNMSSLSGSFSSSMSFSRVSPGSVNSFSEGSQSRNSSANTTSHNFCFHHDRVREAFYQLLSPGRRKCYHYHIGKIMMKELDLSAAEQRSEFRDSDSDDEDDSEIEVVPNIQEGVFLTVINHLGIGQDLISTVPESLEVFDFFYAGAMLCKNLGNLTDALSHIQRAHQLLFYWFGEFSAWDDEYQRTKNLYKTTTEIKAVCASTEDATADFEMIFRHVGDLCDRLEFYVIQLFYHCNMQQYASIQSLVPQVMQEQGITVNAQMSTEQVHEQMEQLRSQFDENLIKLKNLPIATDKQMDMLISFVNEAVMPLYLSSNLSLLCNILSIALSQM